MESFFFKLQPLDLWLGPLISTRLPPLGFGRVIAQVDSIPVIPEFDHRAIWE